MRPPGIRMVTLLATSSAFSLAAAAISRKRSRPSSSRMNSSFRSLRSKRQKVPRALLAGKDGGQQEAWAGARAFADHGIERILLAVGQRRSLSVEQIALHLAGLGIKLQKRAVATTVDPERELDFGLRMRGEVIERPLLPRQLTEEGGKDRADQGRFASAVF